MNEILIKRTLGMVIREKRKIAGLSQTELANKSDITRNFISLIERGDKQPTACKIFSIANAMKILPSDIIREVEKNIGITDKYKDHL